jgi:hypothetical protein
MYTPKKKVQCFLYKIKNCSILINTNCVYFKSNTFIYVNNIYIIWEDLKKKKKIVKLNLVSV